MNGLNEVCQPMTGIFHRLLVLLRTSGFLILLYLFLITIKTVEHWFGIIYF